MLKPKLRINKFRIRKCKQVRNRNKHTTTKIHLEAQTMMPKKGGNKEKKQETPEELYKSDYASLSPAVMECNSFDKLTCDMETEEQVTHIPPNPVNQTKPILVKTQKVLLIVISEEKSWMFVHQKKIQIRHCVTRHYRIQVHSTRLDSHEAITEMLKEGIREYHTFRLPGDKALSAVLRGIPQILSTEEIKDNLTEVVFDVIAASWMHKKI